MPLMVADHFIHHEGEEGFRKIRIQPRFHRKVPQTLHLLLLSRRVSSRQTLLSLDMPNTLGAAESLSQNMDQSSINIVDRASFVRQLRRNITVGQPGTP